MIFSQNVVFIELMSVGSIAAQSSPATHRRGPAASPLARGRHVGYGSARLALRALTTRRLDRRDAALEELDAEPSSSRWAALRQRYDLGESWAPAAAAAPRTAAYAPPELLRRERGVDPKKVDAWAAGVVAYFVFTGRHPFDGGGPATTDRDVERAVLAGAEAAGRFEGADWARARGHARRRRALPEPGPGRAPTLRSSRTRVDQNPAPQHRLVLNRGEAARWVYFEDNFDAGIGDKWVPSEWKDAESTGKWVHTAGEWYAEGQEAIAKGMQASEDMKFHSISAPLDSEATTVGKPLVIQFTVKHEKKDYAFCGGGYIKLLPGKVDAKAFGGDTPYSIMFGPDLCGYDISRVHLIFEHGGENLLKEEEIKLDYADKDEFTHLYTMVLEADGSYEVFFDQVSKASGKIVDDWAFPDAEVKDPAVSKPEDWVDTKKIPDPAAAKPEGYDDIPAEIPDPDAETPEDWDEDEDGEWERR
ncbi:hypothetical protein JL722_15096 [Aureococcus anophagefferens]|nr:hypothetical protein JL722_15096 [Aureococcus anophagefferens]